MKTQPLFVILGAVFVGIVLIVASAIALQLTGTPIALVAGVASTLTGALVAVLGRNAVFAPATAEKLVADALVQPTPDDPKTKAAEMVSRAKGNAS
ncbi:MAG TPA: hypothetical protein VGQ38_15405 [Gaiellaceae bacterium]|jgi:predicted Abi (CAAX) family protease|nr:hypothetical protein [Gaiellaceae bacterium]